MLPLYVNKIVESGQLIIDVPNSLLHKEVDIFIIPKQKTSKHKSLRAKDFVGKLSHLEINDFIDNIENQRLEWERNT